MKGSMRRTKGNGLGVRKGFDGEKSKRVENEVKKADGRRN